MGKVDSILNTGNTPLKSCMKICASDGISEDYLQKIQSIEHNIDIFGIGTNLITCQKTPALGMVCKLIEFEGDARLKFSSDVGKMTLPFRKNCYKVVGEIEGSKKEFTIICEKNFE